MGTAQTSVNVVVLYRKKQRTAEAPSAVGFDRKLFFPHTGSFSDPVDLFFRAHEYFRAPHFLTRFFADFKMGDCPAERQIVAQSSVDFL